jgi:acetyl-CoA synthetase
MDNQGNCTVTERVNFVSYIQTCNQWISPVNKEHGMEKGDVSDTGSQRLVPADLQTYFGRYQESIDDREKYWRNQAARLAWDEPFDAVMDEDFQSARFEWFAGGTLNAAANVLDSKIAAGHASDTALRYFDADNGVTTLTFSELRERTLRTAAALQAFDVGSGDRVALSLPDCLETVYTMLACAWIGAIYVPIPCHFTPEITAEIAADSGAMLMVIGTTSDTVVSDSRIADIMSRLDGITIITADDTAPDGALTFAAFLAQGNPEPPCASVESGQPLFIIYANSAAGIPRGSVFATGGYLVHAATSFDMLFRKVEGCEPSENVLSTLQFASTGAQTYGLWGPLLNGAGIVITAEGGTPDTTTLTRVLSETPSTALLTTPTLLGSLKRTMTTDTAFDTRFTMVAATGDVLAPRLVKFATDALTAGQDRVINLWIQSESGAALMATFPAAELNRPGALGLPACGVRPRAVNYAGEACRANESGQLVFAASWPGMVRTIWGQQERYRELYFRQFSGNFATNDGVRMDGEGFFWFMGRLDDVIKIRGQSLATSEIEAVLVTHGTVREAVVVSLTGEERENLTAFLVLETDSHQPASDDDRDRLERELSDTIAGRIGSFAIPSSYILSRELPRTRTGKVVRRVLRRIATGDISPEEDLSHIANPRAVDELIRKRSQ